MTSNLDKDNFLGVGMDDLQDCFESSDEKIVSADLYSVRRNMLRSLAAPPADCLRDKALLDSLPLASKLLIESVEEAENSLGRETGKYEVEEKLSLWKDSLEPWHEFLKHVKNLGTVPATSIQGLLDSLPGIIQTVFSHCKRSESFYGPKFADLRPRLTALFRQAGSVLDLFFAILESHVEFQTEVTSEKNALSTVLEKIGDIAVLTNGMDLKTQLNTWKAFAKLAATHEGILKKLTSTSCVTRRYVDIIKDIEAFLFDTLKDNKETNYERGIKCAAMLLKILVRLCTLYRGYCGNKVFIVLVQLLTKLHRYSPPCIPERFIHAQPRIGECLATHVAPTIGELLTATIDENEFRKAFFEYGKSQLEHPICYHLLTLRILEELQKRDRAVLSLWMSQKNGNIVDVALENAHFCGEDFLIDTIRIPTPSDPQKLGIYHTTLTLVCQTIARCSVEDFAAVEIALLKHLLSGEFWSCLLSCDAWTFLARVAPSDLCAEHLSFLIKVQTSLTARENSLEFVILSHLIGRMYKLLSAEKSSMREETQLALFHEIEDYSNRRLVDPLRDSLPPRAQQYLWQRATADTCNNLGVIFSNLRDSPSTKNWTLLTSLLKSISALSIAKDRRLCIATLHAMWIFLAANLPKSSGVTREMLLELTALLFDCPHPVCTKTSGDDWLIAAFYKSMTQMVEHLPTEHRLKMNVYFRENLAPIADQSGKQSLAALTELFCCLVSDENPWVRQESFETHTEHIIKSSSSELFGSLCLGISKLPLVNRQITAYFSNTQVHALTTYSSLADYLRDLAASCKNPSTRHKCYEPDFQARDEKKPKLDNLDQRVAEICDQLENLVKRKNDLSSDTTDRLRLVLIKLLEN